MKEPKTFPRYNFHIHTDASDGFNGVEEVLNALKDAGVDGCSVTDHNTVSAIGEAKRLAKRFGVGFVSGVELTAKIPSAYGAHDYAHVLGYGIDETFLLKPLLEEKSARVEATYALLTRLRDGGYDLFPKKPKDKLPLLWSVAVCAAELLKQGCAQTEEEAYAIIERFRGGEVPGFLTVPETIARIHRAGGIAVWAHPFDLVGCVKKRIGITEILSLYDEVFTDADGIEVYYQDFSDSEIRALETFADAKGLIKSVGTDFHRLPKAGEAATGRNSAFFSNDAFSGYDAFVDLLSERFGLKCCQRYKNGQKGNA